MRREKSLNKVRSARRKRRILRVRVRMRASLFLVPSFDSFVRLFSWNFILSCFFFANFLSSFFFFFAS